MSGFEIAGLCLASPPIVFQLIKVTLDGYRVFADARLSGKELWCCQRDLEVQRERLEDWVRRIADHGGDLSALVSPDRYGIILSTLALIAEIFASVNVLEKKYGIRTGAEHGNQSTRHGETGAPENGQKGRKRDWLSRHILRRSGLDESAQTGAGLVAVRAMDVKSPYIVKKASSSVADVSTITVREISQDKNYEDLDTRILGLGKVVQQLEVTVKQYQSNLSGYRQYEWVFSTKAQLQTLISDLKKYTDDLFDLTQSLQGQHIH